MGLMFLPAASVLHLVITYFITEILNEHVAVPMNQLDLVLCDRPVRGSTTKHRLKIPRCASSQFQKSFAARTITEWNSLPDSITSLASVSSFRSHLSATSCPYRRAHSIAEISVRRLALQIRSERHRFEARRAFLINTAPLCVPHAI